MRLSMTVYPRSFTTGYVNRVLTTGTTGNNRRRTPLAAPTIDGANSRQQLFHITLPLLRPTLLFCLVMSVLGSFQVFGQSYVLFAPGSGPARSGLTLALYMYQQGFSQYEIGYGAAIAYLLFALVLLLTLVQFRLFREEAR